MKKTILIVLALCFSAVAQTHYGGGAGHTVWYGSADAPPPPPPAPGENAWCNPGTGVEKSEGTPTWGASDHVALLDNRCMQTALSSTPTGTHPDASPGNTFVPASSATYTNVLASVGAGPAVTLAGNTGGTLHLNCGDTIQLTKNTLYVGTFTYPNITCDGAHWIYTISDGITAPAFPAEGVQATPCASGIANDASHGRSLPGYPDYVCVTPIVLTAKIQSGTGGPGNAGIAFGGATSTTAANHYRFIGIEFVKNPASNVSCLVQLSPDHKTLGANHIIFDRVQIHGVPWTTSSTNADTVQCGITADGSQWVALINSWNYDTYCETSCVDSQAFNFGANINADGPFKLYGNLLASAGETYIGGGGGLGAGMPNTRGFEFRQNWAFKPLTWMVPIESCNIYANVVPKNLGEFKNMTYAFMEGNVFENSWQGCQSDQIGYAVVLNPGSQNNHDALNVNFNGTNVVTISGAGSFTQTGLLSTNVPNDPTYCPPAGCVLEIADSTRLADNGANYRFCNGANSCDQSGIANLKCAVGTSVGSSCTVDSGCPGSTLVGRCAPTTSARLTSTVATGTAVAVNSCVPGDCPACRNQNIVFRLNEIYNVTNGFEVNTGLSSHCHDEAAGMQDVYIGDVKLHGLSTQMSNGSDPYSSSEAFSISSNIEGNVLHNIEIAHLTVGIETAPPGSSSGFGDQVDHTNRHHLLNLNIHDNVSPSAWNVNRSSGSIVTKGVLGKAGLANVYQTDACRSYWPTQAPNGVVVAGNLSAFTFSPSLSNYFVTRNGQYQALASTPAPTSTSFTLSTPAVAGDQITVRDLNDCPYNFAGNILGTGLPGSGKPNDPYPSPNSCGNGPFSPADSCLLDGAAFTGLFTSWSGGRNGDFTITSATYLNAATDADVRSVTGKTAGVDLVTLAATTAGVRMGTVYYPALTITTSALTAATKDTPYQFPLVASTGASPYKGWFLETDTANCGGSCGTLPPGIVIGRGGTVNGPFADIVVSIKNNKAKITLKQTIVAGANSWTVGQKVQLAGFCTDGSNPCTGPQVLDGDFNGTWTVAANSSDCTNSVNVVCLTLTHADIASHAPSTKGTNNPTSTFAPTTVGSYTWWMGARDGAFQTARAQITLVVGSALGILAPARSLDWTQSGIAGGVPSATWPNCATAACTTLFGGTVTGASITAALSSASDNSVVRVPSGAFTLNAATSTNRSNVVLRGAGPTQTTLTLGSGRNVFLGTTGTSGQGGYPPNLGSTNWTGGLTRGSTVLTVAATAGMAVGQHVVLDQHNAAWVSVSGVEGTCVVDGNSCGRNDSPLQFNGANTRAQAEMVEIQSIDSGTQITIKAPGVSFDHSSGLAPQVFYWNTSNGGNIKYVGVENMKVNANGNNFALSMPFCDFCWVRNVEVKNTARSAVWFYWGYRDEIRDSYFSASNTAGAPTEYGLEILSGTLTKLENNIIYGVTTPVNLESSFGTVVGYNYTLNTATDNAFGSLITHLSHNHFLLQEGNSTDTMSMYDHSWGSSSHSTSFRNRNWGKGQNKTNYRYAWKAAASNYYMNVIANVLGDPTYHTRYRCDNVDTSSSDNAIYDLGFFNDCVNGTGSYDTLVQSSLMRWGNWDGVTWNANGSTNGVRFCTGSGAGNPACTVSETANADPTFPGLASPATTFPASFYTGAAAHASCGTGLSFWKNPSTGACPIYPPIGPDVTCTTNCISNTASHAAKIPAQLCYENGAKDGSGFLTAFDAAACYSPDF